MILSYLSDATGQKLSDPSPDVAGMTATAPGARGVTPKKCHLHLTNDLTAVRLRRLITVAVAFADRTGPLFRYHAASSQQNLVGHGSRGRQGDCGPRRDRPDPLRGAGLQRVRFVVNLPPGSPLWRYAPEIAALLPGCRSRYRRSMREPLWRPPRLVTSANACGQLARRGYMATASCRWAGLCCPARPTEGCSVR
jgi:hypothetical protein